MKVKLREALFDLSVALHRAFKKAEPISEELGYYAITHQPYDEANTNASLCPYAQNHRGGGTS